MTNDQEISPDLSENDEPNEQAENLSDLSLSSASEIKSPGEEKELPSELHDQIDEVLHLDEIPAEDDLTKFISKARREGFNCLDLSRKTILEFPETLLEFPSLQVILSIHKIESPSLFPIG